MGIRTASLNDLENQSTNSNTKLEPEQKIETEKLPTRRLYSDVVQGVSPNKASSSKTKQSEATSPSSTRTSNKETPVASPNTTTSTCFSTEETASSSSHNRSTKTNTTWKTSSKTNFRPSENVKILTSTQEVKSSKSSPSYCCVTSKPKSPTNTTKSAAYTTMTYTDNYSSCPMTYTSSWNNVSAIVRGFVANDYLQNDVYACNTFSNTYPGNSLLNTFPSSFYSNPYQVSTF